MADNASSITDSTLVPADSASNLGKRRSNTAKPRAAGPRKGSHKAGRDKDAPPGSIQVPPGGQSKTGKSSPVVSTVIPLSGWGEIDLAPHRENIEPTVTVDAAPYDDLVVNVYMSIQSRFSSGGKHIPFGLFRYYCILMWWYRVLWVHRHNGNVLSSEEKNFLNVIESGEEFHLPSHIAQYLAHLGNYQQGSENFYFRLPPHELGDVPNGDVRRGWFVSADPNNRADADTWWRYAQLPAPGVAVCYAMNEADAAAPNPINNPQDLLVISPVFDGNSTTTPTDNIVGWNNSPFQAYHQSWRTTYSNLGWGGTSTPGDFQTVFNVSTSTLRWVSDRLSQLHDFKVYSSKQLSLSVQGDPLQAYWLESPFPRANVDQRPPNVDNLDVNHLNGSLNTELCLRSRYSMDPKVLAPAFSFGYRIRRSLVWLSDAPRTGLPVYANRSNYQPWLITSDADGLYRDFPAAWFNTMNDSFDFGSQPFLNVARFSTHGLVRSVALDAAVVLSDSK